MGLRPPFALRKPSLTPWLRSVTAWSRSWPNQEESHKAALKAVQDSEAALQAEYEIEAASWAEAKQTLINGYGQIEDLVDGRPPSSSSLLAACRLAHFLTWCFSLLSLSFLHRVLPWLLYRRQPSRQCPPRGAKADWC